MAHTSRQLNIESSELKALRREVAEAMEPTRHIQRLLKPNAKSSGNPYLFGAGRPNGGFDDSAFDAISKIFSFDYMGRGEYEFGALPNSVGRIYDYATNGNLARGSVKLGLHEVFYICRKDMAAEVERRIKKLGEGESWEQRGPKKSRVLTSDFVGLRRSLDSRPEDARMPVGWLEIDNHFLFFTDRGMFSNAAGLFGLKP